MSLFRSPPKPSEQVACPQEQRRQPNASAYWARRAQQLLSVPVPEDSPQVSGDLPRRAGPLRNRGIATRPPP